jgi:hypothetical protein
MRTIGSQRGDGKAGCLFWVLVVLALAVAASKLVPPELAKMKLRDEMQELVLTRPHQPQGFFEKEIGNKARMLGIDVRKDQIQVKKYEKRIIMEVRYVVPVDFYFFRWDWSREIRVDEDIFYF